MKYDDPVTVPGKSAWLNHQLAPSRTSTSSASRYDAVFRTLCADAVDGLLEPDVSASMVDTSFDHNVKAHVVPTTTLNRNWLRL
jgi:hypothetical protein